MSKIITLEMAKERLEKSLGKDYSLVEYNPGKYSKSKLLHKCGHTYELANYRYFMNNDNGTNGKCPYCFNTYTLYTKEKVQEIVNQYLDESYIVLEYINKRTPIKILHKKCGNTIKMYLRNIYKGQRCKKCESGYKRISELKSYKFEDFSNVTTTKSNGNLTLLEFSSFKNKAKFHCNVCNSDFENYPRNISSGTGCPYCSASSGEQKIKGYLESKTISYEFQKRITIKNNTYTLDFFLPTLNMAIEFDGKQHSHPAFGATKEEREATLAYNKERDKKKSSYCRRHNIKLIRIPFNKINRINDILDEKIYSSTTIENKSE